MKALMIILTAMFTGAQLAGVISWPWWLVMSPVIIYAGGYTALIIFTFLLALIMSFCESFEESFRNSEKEQNK